MEHAVQNITPTVIPNTTECHVYDVQDIEFYNSLKYILDDDPEPLCLRFTATRDHYGEVVKRIIISLQTVVTIRLLKLSLNPVAMQLLLQRVTGENMSSQ